MGNIIDLTGQRFGRLVVMYRIEDYICKNGYIKSKWHCKCDCGNEVDVIGNNLRKGNTKSCGCYNVERIVDSNSKLNKYVINDDCIIVDTSNGIKFVIDKDDEWILKKYCWHINKQGYVCSCERGGKNSTIRISRILMHCDDNNVVDHIDGDPLNNRKNNLRIVTQAENRMNSAIRSDNISGCTGVSFDARSNKWCAQIMFKHKHIHLGLFDNFEDAVAARKAAEEKYFGEYSYDNSRNKQSQE